MKPRVSMHWHKCSFNGRRVYEVWDLVSGLRVLRTYSWRAAAARENRMLTDYARLDLFREEHQCPAHHSGK